MAAGNAVSVANRSDAVDGFMRNDPAASLRRYAGGTGYAPGYH